MKEARVIEHDETIVARRKFVISAIGTGGHYFPAFVVAKELMQRNTEVIVLVRRGFSENGTARLQGLKTFPIKARAFYGKSVLNKMWSVLLFIHSTYSLISLVKDASGIVFGGFGALPLVAACLIKRRKFFFFEPNRMPGRATRLFASKASIVFLGLPPAGNIKGRLLVTGIPIRHEFKKTMADKMTRHRTLKTVLFLGGSGGASMVNELALEVQEILPDNYRIVIISGQRDYDWVLKRSNGRTSVIPFTHTPWLEMRTADVIVARSGALAAYEILSTNTPVIFIPFPYAIDDHQYHNAKYFARIGNAVVMRQEQVTGKKIVEKLTELLDVYRGKADIIWDAEKQIADTILRDK